MRLQWMEEAFFRRHPGAFSGEANRNEGARSAHPMFLPFIKAENPGLLHNGRSSPSLRRPAWWKDEQKWGCTIWIVVWCRIHEHHTTPKNILSFIQVYSLPLSPFSVPSQQLILGLLCPHCLHYAECLNAVNYLKGKVCTCWKAIHACLAC